MPEIDTWPPLLAVHEREVGEHGLAGLVEADRERLAHLVDEQCLGARVAGRSVYHRPGMGRQPQLRLGAQHEDLGAADGLTGHRAVDHVARVRRPLGALEHAGLLDDDAVVRDLAAAVREELPADDQVVELDGRVVVEDHVEAARAGLHRAVDGTDAPQRESIHGVGTGS